MTLRDAIYTPSDIHMCRKRRSHMNREEIRKARLIEENIKMWTVWLDHVFEWVEEEKEFKKLWEELFNEKPKNRVNMKPKKSLLDRFISFFK